MNIKQFLDNLFEVIENGDANEVRYCILEGLKNFEEILPLDKAYLKRNTNILFLFQPNDFLLQFIRCHKNSSSA